MKEVVKFFGLKAGETQVCNGWKFECIKVDKELAKKLDSAPCLFGTLTSPDGKITEYLTKHVLASKLNKIAGVNSSSKIPAKVDNSQQNGENKVVHVSMSASKQSKRFLKAYKLCRQASEYYGLTDIFSGMLEQLQNLDRYVINCERVKTEQAIERAKAEAEVKKQAEAEAKQQAKIAEAAELLIQQAMKNGLTREAAESSLKALGLI